MAAERKVTIGADPEIPLYVADTHGGSLCGFPATGLFGGDKGKPVVLGEEGGWLEDGAMLELNPTASENPYTLAKNINTLLTKAVAHIKDKTHEIEGIEYRIKLSVGGVQTYIEDSLLEKYPQLKVFGCSEDFSAYTPGVPRSGVMDEAAREFGPNLRFAGGHLHLGLSDWPKDLPKFVAIKLLDLLFYVPYQRMYSRSEDRDYYYGLPGLYRETKYGIEYRTPCPSWVAPADKRILMRFFDVGMIFARFEKYKNALVDIYNAVPWNELQDTLLNREYATTIELLSGAGVAKGDHYAIQLEDLFVPLRSADYPIFPGNEYTSIPEISDPLKPKKNIYYTMSTTAGGAQVGQINANEIRWPDLNLGAGQADADQFRAMINRAEVPPPPQDFDNDVRRAVQVEELHQRGEVPRYRILFEGGAERIWEFQAGRPVLIEDNDQVQF